MITERNKQRLRALRDYLPRGILYSSVPGYLLDSNFADLWVSNSIYSVRLDDKDVFTIGFEDGANPDINPFINDFCAKLEKYSEELDKIVEQKKKEKIEEANNIFNKYN